MSVKRPPHAEEIGCCRWSWY